MRRVLDILGLPATEHTTRSATATPLASASADAEDQAIRRLYQDVLWSGPLHAAGGFNAAFAVRLGASNAMIGWLSSLPSFLSMLFLIPSARFLETKAHRTPWLWGSVLVTRLSYVALVLLPFIFHEHLAEAVVVLLIAASIPSTFLNAGFNPLFADVVSEANRTRVLAGRSIIVGATVALFSVVAGRWLETSGSVAGLGFPVNYQIMYMVAFATSLLSLHALMQIKAPPSTPQPAVPLAAPTHWLRDAAAMFQANASFRKLVFNTMIYDSGAWMVSPLYIIYFVRELGASDGWIGLNSTLASIGGIVGHLLWRRWIRRLGYSRSLLLTVPLGASYAYLLGLFPNLTLILVWGTLNNIINPGISLSHFNLMLKVTPEERRPSYLATYSTLASIGAFIMPLVGVTLSGVFTIRLVLLAGASMRLAGSFLFYIFRIRVQESEIH